MLRFISSRFASSTTTSRIRSQPCSRRRTLAGGAAGRADSSLTAHASYFQQVPVEAQPFAGHIRYGGSACQIGSHARAGSGTAGRRVVRKTAGRQGDDSLASCGSGRGRVRCGYLAYNLRG